MMQRYTVLATPYLVKILHGIPSIRQRTEHHMPLLVDGNIRYTVLSNLLTNLVMLSLRYQCS